MIEKEKSDQNSILNIDKSKKSKIIHPKLKSKSINFLRKKEKTEDEIESIKPKPLLLYIKYENFYSVK